MKRLLRHLIIFALIYKSKMKKLPVRYKLLAVAFVLLFLDQWLKCYVKTHFYLSELYPVLGQWFYLCFVENDGMAFGWTLGGGTAAKVILTLVRILGIGSFIYLFIRYLKKVRYKADNGRMLFFFYAATLVLTGAVGNLTDTLFYGLFFTESGLNAANLAQWSFAEHYGVFGMGRVVDMFYFPLFTGHFPQWLPIWGGEEFLFFSPVFNLADSYIFVGIIGLLFTIKFIKKV